MKNKTDIERLRPSLEFGIRNKVGFEKIINSFREARGNGKAGDQFLESMQFLGTGLTLLGVEQSFTALK